MSDKSILYLHAIAGSIAWAVILPIGAAVRKLASQARWHAMVMATGAILIVISVAAGITISMRSRQHSSFHSAHQIIGLTLFPLLVIQAAGGSLNHLYYKKTGNPTWLGIVHKYLGPALITVGILNGYLGIDYARDNRYILPYIVAVVVWLYVLTMFTVMVRRAREGRLLKVTGQGFPSGVEAGEVSKEH